MLLFTPHIILHIKRCHHLEQMFFHYFETINKPELLLKNFPLYYSGGAKIFNSFSWVYFGEGGKNIIFPKELDPRVM